MNNSDWITIWGIAIGLFVTTIGSALLLSFKIGGLHEKVISMEKIFQRIPRIEGTIVQIQVKMTEMQVKLDLLWLHHLSWSRSPRVLNEAGLRLLEASNIDRFVEHYYGDILEKVRAARPENAYQAQQALISIVSDYQNIEECRLKLQETAFTTGSDVNSLLFVGALTIRDKIVSELKFK